MYPTIERIVYHFLPSRCITNSEDMKLAEMNEIVKVWLKGLKHCNGEENDDAYCRSSRVSNFSK